MGVVVRHWLRRVSRVATWLAVIGLSRPHWPEPLERIGSLYGGWFIDCRLVTHGGSVVSCGAGEDISFDIDLARRFGVVVLIVDPTPRAQDHFRAVLARCGMPKESEYRDIGNQEASAYELSGIRAEQLVLEPVAVWDEDAMLNFYPPRDPSHVSHSLVDYQGSARLGAKPLRVRSVDFGPYLTRSLREQPSLVKLDVEGAENRVVPSMLGAGIRPRQVLIEFDELNEPSVASLLRFWKTHRLLAASGYRCAKVHYPADLTYILLSDNS